MQVGSGRAPPFTIHKNFQEPLYDDYLNQAYVRVRDILPASIFSEVRKSQVAWVKVRDALCGGDVQCLLKETHTRTAVLNRIAQDYIERHMFKWSDDDNNSRLETSKPVLGQNGPLDPKDIYRLASQSVVIIMAYNKRFDSIVQGGGVVIKNNTIATNCHVIDDADEVAIIFNGEIYEMQSYDANYDNDFCVIQTRDLPASAATIGSIATVNPGQRVYSIGSPQGLELTIAEGLVSGLRERAGMPLPIIQTSAAISPGSSGGGLFDEFGRVIGVTTFFFEGGQNLNFALPVELFREFE
jgi:S1-C subfamily serine protease